MNYVVINKMTCKAGKREEVIRILLESGKSFNKNSACLLYQVSAAIDDVNVIWVEDVWSNKLEHEEAMQTENMQKYIQRAMPLLAGKPEQFEVKSAGGKASWL